MKVLVIGRAGQVATCLQRLATDEVDFSLECMGRPELDLESLARAIEIVMKRKPDVLVNAAAFTDVERAEVEPEKAFAINARASGALAVAANRMGVPFIHISTDYVFSGEKTEPYCETDDVSPINSYGLSKLQGECAIQAAHDDAIILRTSWVYSPFGKNFLKTIYALMQSQKEINVVDDQHGSPTSAWEISKAILKICELKHKGHQSTGIYHLAASGATTWYGFANFIRSMSGLHTGRNVQMNPIPSSAFATKAKRPKNSVLDTSKLYRDFDIHLPAWRLSVRECLDQLIALNSK